MVTLITQNSLERTTLYAVASDSDRPSSSPSTSSVRANGGDLPLPYDLTNLGDPAAEVAALLAISFQEDRKRAKEASDLEELNRLREGEMRVAEMHQKADEIRAEGWARGLSQVLSAACSVTGGVQSLGEKEAHTAQALLSLWSGGAKGFEACGTITGNDHQADAVEHQAQADLFESHAEARRVARDKFEEQASDARQMLQKVLEFVKEMNEVRNETLQAVASFKA